MTVDLSSLEQNYNLPSGLLDAVQQQESGGDPNAISPAGAIGAFQFEPATAAQYGIDPTDPDQSAVGAAKMYSDLLTKYKGDLPSALAAYNWGQGNVDRKGLENAPPETQNYITKILSKVGNVIVPSAQAAESDPYANLSDDQLKAEAQKQGLNLGANLPPIAPEPDTTSVSADIGASSQLPASQQVQSQSVDTQLPDGTSLTDAEPDPYGHLTDEQLLAEAKQQGVPVTQENKEDTPTKMGTEHKEMLGNAEKAMGPQGSAMGLWANLVGAGANAVSGVPGLKETGSALAALAGQGQGSTFGERYDNLEKAQQVMREASKENEPTINTPSFLPDIKPSGLEKFGASLAASPVAPTPGASGGYLSAIAKGLGYGGLNGSVYGFGDTNSFLPSEQAAEERAGNAGEGATIGAATGGVLGATSRAVSDPIENATADAAKSVASGFYKAADNAGGVIDNPSPIFDQMRGKDPVTPTEIALAKTDPVRKFLNDFKDSANAPMTLSDAQGIDEELSNRIDQQFDKINGMSKDGYKLLDAQTKFRQGLAATPPQAVGGGQAGYEAWQNGQQAWQQAMKLQDLERMQTRANMTANPPTSLQTQIKNYLTSSRSRALSDAERQSLEVAQKRGFIGDALHVMGSRLVPYVGTMVGEGVGGLPGAIIGGGIGHGGSALARMANTALQNGKLTKAANIIGKGIPTP